MLPRPLVSTAFAAALSLAASAQANDMTQKEIRNGYIEHAAMAQFHRWYQFYERPEGGVENALDILTGDVTITSGLGTANGHEEYSQRVQQLPTTWQNAHFVKDASIDIADDGTASLRANVLYQNTGILENGAVRQADLTYTVSLVPGQGTVLPLLSEVLIEQNSDETAETWIDAYPENRALSLVHYYLSVIEDPARDPEPMRELFAENFSLNFSSGAITDFEGFKAWLAGPGSQIAASTHVIENFSVENAGDNKYVVQMDFDWAGILPDGNELVVKTRHNWVITNDVKERFARIQTVDVEILEPLRPRGN